MKQILFILAFGAAMLISQCAYAQNQEPGLDEFVQSINCSQDESVKAFNLMQQSADLGYEAAYIPLGAKYGEGKGCTRDLEQAIYWYERGIDAGRATVYNIRRLALFYQEIGNESKYAQYQSQYRRGIQQNIYYYASASTESQDSPAKSQRPRPRPSSSPTATPIAVSKKLSDVDKNIPMVESQNSKVFAFIIANENYQLVSKVDYAINDGEILAKYLQQTLGLPKENIKMTTNATLNNMRKAFNTMEQIGKSYNGEASFIIYYAGHGIPNESNGSAYLLPIDGEGSDYESGYSLDDFYKRIGNVPSKRTIVLMDACFSGAIRGNGMLAAARGVAIKAKQSKPVGNMVVLSAAQGDETAWPYKEEGHGLFTYYILKSLQETKGSITLGDFAQYIQEQVSRKSIVINEKPQTPCVSVSTTLGEEWKKWTLR